jgi:hydrogenase 3 maturation protease
MNFTHLTDELSKYQDDRIVFVGLGNELRADDGAGLKLVERLKSKKEFKNSHFILAERNPENHLQEIISYNPQIVIFVDAADWNGNAGDIKIFNDEEVSQSGFSTHTFSIKMIKDFLLNHQQMDFMFIGNQPLTTNFSEGLSPQVKKKLDEFFDD